MKLFLDTSKTPLACLTVSKENLTLQPMQTIFFGDILPLELVLHDGAGGQPSWINDAEIKVGFGDLAGQNAFLESVCTNTNNTFTASLDFSTADFDQATANIETVGIVFEVQASFATGKTETICQQRLNLNNQILNQQTVALVAPAAPNQVDIDLVPQPKQPASVSIEIAPIAPRSVISEVSLVAFPEAPSVVFIAVRPIAPSSVTGGLIPYPPSNVVPVSNPLPPSSVTALTKPQAPSSVTAGRLPLAPLMLYIEPEEPTPNVLWHPYCHQYADLIFWADAREESLVTSDNNGNILFVDTKEFGESFQLTQADANKRFAYDAFDDAFVSESGDFLELVEPIIVDVTTEPEPPMNYYIICEGQGELLTGGIDGQTQEWTRFELGRGSRGADFAHANTNALGAGNTQFLQEFNLQGWTPFARQLINLEIDIANGQGVLRINGLQRSSFSITTNHTTTQLPFIFDKIGGDWIGKIHEVVLFKGANTPYVEGYLAHKWQLQSKLPSNHQYKSSFPKSCLHNDPCNRPICFAMDDGSGQIQTVTINLTDTKNIWTGSQWVTMGTYSATADNGTTPVSAGNGQHFQEGEGLISTVISVAVGTNRKDFMIIYDEDGDKCPIVMPVENLTDQDIEEKEEQHGEKFGNLLRRQKNKRDYLRQNYKHLCGYGGHGIWYCEDGEYSTKPPYQVPSYCTRY
jgi:hypothetical protein